jgi:hypothetical protein
MRAFVTALFVGLSVANLSAACFFGGMLLLNFWRYYLHLFLHPRRRLINARCSQIASQSDQTLTEVVNILSELGNRLEIFETYRQSMDLDQETLQAFFDTLVDLTINIAAAIKHFRRYRIRDALSPSSNWSALVKRFSDNIRTLQSRLDHLQKLAEAKNSAHRSQAELIRKLDELSMQPLPSTALRAPRCHTIPYPQNPGFFGRADTLQLIAAGFEDQASRVASVAMWGAGGIGKTQIAMEFAHKMWADGEEVILWIASETSAEVAHSFNEAARQLKLEGYSDSNTLDKNRHLVLQWLQHTGRSLLPPGRVFCGRLRVLRNILYRCSVAAYF